MDRIAPRLWFLSLGEFCHGKHVARVTVPCNSVDFSEFVRWKRNRRRIYGCEVPGCARWHHQTKASRRVGRGIDQTVDRLIEQSMSMRRTWSQPRFIKLCKSSGSGPKSVEINQHKHFAKSSAFLFTSCSGNLILVPKEPWNFNRHRRRAGRREVVWENVSTASPSKCIVKCKNMNWLTIH